MLLEWGWAFGCKEGKVVGLDRPPVGEGSPVEDTWGIACTADWGGETGLGLDRAVGVEFLP